MKPKFSTKVSFSDYGVYTVSQSLVRYHALKKHACPSSSSSIIPDQLEHIDNNYMYVFDFEGLVQRKDEDKVYEVGTVGRMLKGGRAGR